MEHKEKSDNRYQVNGVPVLGSMVEWQELTGLKIS